MKRVTNKTAWNIYQSWMTVIHMDLPIVSWFLEGSTSKSNGTIKESLEIINKLESSDESLIKFNWVLEDYNDKQIQKVILGIENGTQWEGEYLKKHILHLLQSQLRERKLNNLGI